ncbi:transposase [Frankia sp. AiPs1]
MDSLVMVRAHQYQDEFIFGFDDAFHKNGYRLPPAARS